MDMVLLRKYSIDRPKTNIIVPGSFEGIIKFEVDGRVTLTEGVYLTTNEFDSSDKAQDYLSITYSPKYECVFRIDGMDRNKIELRNPYLGNEPTRIWPAFGKPGGGCEIILTKGKLKYTAVKEKFPYGGKTDPFHYDRAQTDKIFANELVQKLYDWLKGRKNEVNHDKEIGYKILDGCGVIINWIGIPSHKFYTISCAYKESKNKNSVKLRFWGYVWYDKHDKIEERVLYKPVIRDITLSCGIKDLIKKINQHQDPFTNIENTLSEVHDCLIPIAQNFDNCDNDIIVLPPFVSLFV